MSAFAETLQQALASATAAYHLHLSPHVSDDLEARVSAYVEDASTNQLILTAGAGLLLAYVASRAVSSAFAKPSRSEPPMIPYTIPFIGSMLAFGLDPVKFLQVNREKYGDYFTFLMFGRKMTYCLGADGNNLVLNAKLANVSAEEAYSAMTTPVFGKGVIYDVPNHVFMEQKRFVKHGLNNENLRSYVPIVQRETEAFFQKWDQPQGTGNLYVALSELIINTATACLFGDEVRSKMDESVAALYSDLDKGFTPLNFLFPSIPFLPAYRRRDAAHAKMSEIFKGVLAERRASGKTGYTDLMQSLDEAVYKDGKTLTDAEICNMMIAILMGGQHTSSTTTTWAFLYLMEEPDLFEALLDEQKQVLGEDLPPLDHDSLRRLPLLDAVMRETLRLRPPLLTMLRKVTSPLRIPGSDMIIPKGHYVGVSPAVSALDPASFPNPERFEPRRWLDPEVAANFGAEADEVGVQEDYGFGKISGTARSPYLPFGAGRHRCIGEPFAYMQVKTIIAILVRHFNFTPVRKFPGKDNTTLIAQPVKPVLVNYTRRS